MHWMHVPAYPASCGQCRCVRLSASQCGVLSPVPFDGDAAGKGVYYHLHVSKTG